MTPLGTRSSGGLRCAGVALALVATACGVRVAAVGEGAGGGGLTSPSGASNSGQTASTSSSGGAGGGPSAGCAHFVRTDYQVEVGPLSVAVGDLAGDGRPDLAVGGGTGTALVTAVSFLRNAGGGTFAAGAPYTIGTSFDVLVALGDLNGDGRLDLVVSDNAWDIMGATSSVKVLLNTGPGTFAAPTSYSAVGPNIGPPVVADLNGDGKPDVAITNAAAVQVFLSAGDGSLLAPVAQPVPDSGYTLAMGDLNGDGKPDLALIASPHGAPVVEVLMNIGGGRFGAPSLYPIGYAADFPVMADLNGDGKLDLVVVDTNGVGVLFGAGDGTVAAMSLVPLTTASPTALAVADLNGDGMPDIAVTDSWEGSVHVLLNAGHGAFTAGPNLAVGARPQDIVIADLNGDGLPDMVVTNAGDGSVSVLLHGTCAPCGGALPDDCSGSCTNTNTDHVNCGACGTVCPHGAACTGGACSCEPGWTVCDGYCTDLSTDPSNCGACGFVCAGEGPPCNAGMCG